MTICGHLYDEPLSGSMYLVRLGYSYWSNDASGEN